MNHLRSNLSIAVSLWCLLFLAACERTREATMVGTLERDRVEVTVESSEPIVSRHVQDGQEVAAGDLLMRQDPARPQARRDQAQAQRDQAAARLAELRRGPREETILETRARLAAAQAETVNARAEFGRVRDVFDRGLSSQSALDQAEARSKAAAAGEQAVREALEAQLVGTTIEELDQAEAALAAAEAVLAQAQVDLQRTELRAPVDGIVDKLLFQVGERPPPGTTVAVVLAAGAGTRFEGPTHKLAATIDGVPVLDRAVRAALDADIGPVVVVIGSHHPELPTLRDAVIFALHHDRSAAIRNL